MIKDKLKQLIEKDKGITPESFDYSIDLWTFMLISQLCIRFEKVRNWQIMGVVECDIINVPEGCFAIENKKHLLDRKHKKQECRQSEPVFECEYIWEEKSTNEKGSYGTIMLPINGGEFIKISFSN
jgi:hypothetical protein